MHWNRGRRAGIVVCAVIVAAIGGLAAAWPASQLAGGKHEAVRPHPAGGGVRTTLPDPTCGAAAAHLVNGVTPFFQAPPATLACFSTAARECKAASIAVVENGVDTGTSYVFVIEPGGTPCRVTELTQDYSANFGGSLGSVSSTPCRRTAVTARGVVLKCGGPDILIPASDSVKSPAVVP